MTVDDANTDDMTATEFLRDLATTDEDDTPAYVDNGKYVSKFYEMNPETDDLLSTGDKLRNGMMVLIEDEMARGDDEHIHSRYDTRRLRENNRWCEVSEVKLNINDSHGEYGQVIDQYTLVSFVGIYEGGVKAKRTYNASYAWLVKLDSIPNFPPFVGPNGEHSFIPRVGWVGCDFCGEVKGHPAHDEAK